MAVKRGRRILAFLLAWALFLSGFAPGVRAVEPVDDPDVKAFFSESAILGNSLGQGLWLFFQTQDYDYLGHPAFYVTQSYSFLSDRAAPGNFDQYKLAFNGVPMAARDVVRLSGAKRVFVSMGINDLWNTVEGVYELYTEYIEGIREDSPGVQVFVCATTPCVRDDPNGLNNEKADALNVLMEAYAARQREVYFIDISTPLKGEDGRLRDELCWDNFCHLTMEGYRIWAETIAAYVRKMLRKEKAARRALRKAERVTEKYGCREIRSFYYPAKRKIKSLGLGKVRSRYVKRLAAIRKVYYKEKNKELLAKALRRKAGAALLEGDLKKARILAAPAYAAAKDLRPGMGRTELLKSLLKMGRIPQPGARIVIAPGRMNTLTFPLNLQ